ncbi:hypothetical protein FWH09_02720 [Candidatus Saccharibacteria bacterium]|nr:hypothetical protein [Candidatus Saccharibacteria bacterium]
MFWQSHNSFDSEFAKIAKKMRTLEDSFGKAKKLLEVQFDPVCPQQVIAPAKIHRIHADDIWTLWKLEMVVMSCGLRPSQYPRVWLVVSGNTVTFLAICSHMKNYDDNEINRIALERFSEIA